MFFEDKCFDEPWFNHFNSKLQFLFQKVMQLSEENFPLVWLELCHATEQHLRIKVRFASARSDQKSRSFLSKIMVEQTTPHSLVQNFSCMWMFMCSYIIYASKLFMLSPGSGNILSISNYVPHLFNYSTLIKKTFFPLLYETIKIQNCYFLECITSVSSVFFFSPSQEKAAFIQACN